MKNVYQNDFQTPPEALEPLLPYLRKEWVIWECACGKGYLVDAFRKQGFRVIGTDILTGHDFLKWEPENYDCIVTNPPYSIKQCFLERCYGLDKPFALLLPLTTFETEKRQKLFREHGVQVIFLNKRINFHTPDGGGHGAWFAVCWITHGLNLPRDMLFVAGKQINRNR